MRILVAEDDATSRLILGTAIRNFGHECDLAADGEQAWKAYLRSPAQVVISDWMMPGMDGLELCERIRAHPDSSYAYVILLTALHDRDHVLMGMEAGADDYLTKPLDLDQLQTRLIAALRVTALHAQLDEQRAQLEVLNAELFETAHTDALTRLGNRLRLGEDLKVLDSRLDRYGQRFSMAMVDIDHFKAYNDTHGHQAGDKALRLVADTISSTIRGGDVAYRYGGEEFLCIYPEQSLDSALIAAERLRLAVEGLEISHPVCERTLHLTVSAGVASSLESPDSSEEAIKRADTALYRAKAAGRNRVELA